MDCSDAWVEMHQNKDFRQFCTDVGDSKIWVMVRIKHMDRRDRIQIMSGDYGHLASFRMNDIEIIHMKDESGYGYYVIKPYESTNNNWKFKMKCFYSTERIHIESYGFFLTKTPKNIDHISDLIVRLCRMYEEEHTS